MNKPIPNETIGRLLLYFRAFVCLEKENAKTVSSSRLSEVCNINPSIIRKDFSYFGELGTRGVGYDVNNLIHKIRNILGLDPVKKAVLVGVGNIGKALLSYPNFESEGFKIVMAFDNQSEIIGREINGVIVEDAASMEDRIRSENIQLGIMAVPESEAPEIARRMAKGGVSAILSFAPCQLLMPDNVKITCVDLAREIARLVYYSSKEAASAKD
jgi:redox-sensing transcriptional repressor